MENNSYNRTRENLKFQLSRHPRKLHELLAQVIPPLAQPHKILCHLKLIPFVSFHGMGESLSGRQVVRESCLPKHKICLSWSTGWRFSRALHNSHGMHGLTSEYLDSYLNLTELH